MTNDLSHDWQTDSSQSEDKKTEEQISHAPARKIPIEAETDESTNPSKEDPLFNPFETSLNPHTTKHDRLPMMVGGILLGFTVMGAFLFLFFRGVLFLQANILLDDQASVAILGQGSSSSSEDLANVPLPTLVAASSSSSAVEVSSSSASQRENTSSSAAPAIPVLTIRVTDENQAAIWPTSLKMNRYTVGSALVPDLSKVIPMPVFAVSKAEARMHGAAGGETALNAINRVPPTGPALWILLALCLGVTPIFFVRSKTRHAEWIALTERDAFF